jgi:hypothetical protein
MFYNIKNLGENEMNIVDTKKLLYVFIISLTMAIVAQKIEFNQAEELNKAYHEEIFRGNIELKDRIAAIESFKDKIVELKRNQDLILDKLGWNVAEKLEILRITLDGKAIIEHCIKTDKEILEEKKEKLKDEIIDLETELKELK